MKDVFLLLLLALCLSAPAQTRISGLVCTQDSLPLENCTVALLQQDSTLVKGAVSDAKGGYRFDGIQPGAYLFLYSCRGFADHYSPGFIVRDGQEQDAARIYMTPAATSLQSVSVIAPKPLFEQKIDRMLINVRNSITNAGGTVLDVLAKSPGVVVNKGTNSITLNGKDGIGIMINGKITYMQQDAVMQMLSGMNASSVERIELITTPPSRYDAGGNAGYINIVLLDNPNQGFSGSYSASMGGGHGTLPTAAADFNFRKGSINLYGSYSFSREAIEQIFTNRRKVLYNDTLRESNVVDDRHPVQTNHNGRLGLDYQVTKKTVIGALVAGYNHKWAMNANNNSTYATNAVIDTFVHVDNQESNGWNHLMGNLNLQHTFRPGEELAINTDYLYYFPTDNNPTEYQNYYLDQAHDSLFSSKTVTGKKTTIRDWVSQVDFSKLVNSKTGVQLGAKYVLSDLSNDAIVRQLENNQWVTDSQFTANNHLREYIAAGYVSLDQKLDGHTTLKAGLRYEYTLSNLTNDQHISIVDRKYGNLFPTIFLHRQINDKNGLSLSYTRRIDRPNFSQLAPFLIFFDPKTFVSGNPALQPSFTDALKFDYTLNRCVFSVNYSYTHHPIVPVASTDPSDNTQTVSPQNLDLTRRWYISLVVPLSITPWWSSQTSISYVWSQTKGVVNQVYAGYSGGRIQLNGTETFTLPERFVFELSGFFQSRGYQGITQVSPFGALDAAISRKFGERGGRLVIGVNNIFNSQVYKSYLSIPGQNIETWASYQSGFPFFKLAWSSGFGNRRLKSQRQRHTASEDERKRIE